MKPFQVAVLALIVGAGGFVWGRETPARTKQGADLPVITEVEVTDTWSGQQFTAEVVTLSDRDQPSRRKVVRTGVGENRHPYRIDATFGNGKTLVLFCVVR